MPIPLTDPDGLFGKPNQASQFSSCSEANREPPTERSTVMPKKQGMEILLAVAVILFLPETLPTQPGRTLQPDCRRARQWISVLSLGWVGCVLLWLVPGNQADGQTRNRPKPGKNPENVCCLSLLGNSSEQRWNQPQENHRVKYLGVPSPVFRGLCDGKRVTELSK